MEFKRYSLVLAAIVLLAALPFLVVYPSGTASAGLSGGFLAIMDTTRLLLLVLPIGVMASYLRGDGRLILPLCFLLMFLIGAMLEMDFVLYPMVRMFILGAILIFGLSLSVVDNRPFLVFVLIGASVAYHLGGWGMHELPALASPLYFIIGQLLALVLVLAISYTIGLILFGEFSSYRKRDAHAAAPGQQALSQTF